MVQGFSFSRSNALFSASFIGRQVFANWLVGENLEKNIVSPSTAAIFLAMISIICFTRGLRGTIQTTAFTSIECLSMHIFLVVRVPSF